MAPTSIKNGMAPSVKEATTFWRDTTLPFIEARSTQDGRKVCYAKHTHDTFSIGAITGGQSTYVNGKMRERVGVGAIVVVNPEEVHACNPIDDQPWSYRMLYADAQWLAELQRELGGDQNSDFRMYSTNMVACPELYLGLNRLYAILTDPRAEHLQKHSAALSFFSMAHRVLQPGSLAEKGANHRLARAAEYIRENCTRSLKLEVNFELPSACPCFMQKTIPQNRAQQPPDHQPYKHC